MVVDLTLAFQYRSNHCQWKLLTASSGREDHQILYKKPGPPTKLAEPGPH